MIRYSGLKMIWGIWRETAEPPFLTDIYGHSILFRKDQSCLRRQQSRYQESFLQELSDTFFTETENIVSPHIWAHRSGKWGSGN